MIYCLVGIVTGGADGRGGFLDTMKVAIQWDVTSAKLEDKTGFVLPDDL